VEGRKCIRLHRSAYVGRGSYFVTVCTLHRRREFLNGRVADFVVASLRKAAARENFILHAWCVMPDHLHILAEGATDSAELYRFVNHWKCATTNAFLSRFGRELWQRSFFDRKLRNLEAADTVCWYIWMNPVRKGLCTEPQEYRWSGSATVDFRQTKPSRDEWIPPWRNPL
jgi:REP element-mobilizing transposase RayT